MAAVDVRVSTEQCKNTLVRATISSYFYVSVTVAYRDGISVAL